MRRLGFQSTALVVLVGCGGGAADASGSAGAGSNAGGNPSAGSAATAGGSANAGAPATAGESAGGRGGAGGSTGGGGNAGAIASAGAGGSAGASGAAGTAGSGGGLVLVGTGMISYERWDGVKGEAVSLVPVSEKPTVTMDLMAFQMPDDVGQDFGARLRGYLTAPLTGDYTFFISCDDNGELSISKDESPSGKQRIAYVSGSPAWTNYVEWNKFPTQKSAPVALVAGKRYYVEALLKEDIAEDHLAVGWLKPGEVGVVPSEIVPGKQLTPFKP